MYVGVCVCVCINININNLQHYEKYKIIIISHYEIIKLL